MTRLVGRVPPLGDEADKTGLRGAVDASRSVDDSRSIPDAVPVCRRLAPALCRRPASVTGQPAGARRIVASCVPGPFYPSPPCRLCRDANFDGADVNQAWCRDARTRGQPSHGHGQSKSFARSVSPSRCPHSEWVKLLIHMACCSAFEVFLGRLITTDAAVLARMWCSRSSRRCAPVSPGEAVKQVMNDRGPDHSKRRTGTGRTTLAWCLLASWLVASGGVLLAHMKNNPVDVCVTRN